jgi:LysR family transcriptional regulator for metE and metH
MKEKLSPGMRRITLRQLRTFAAVARTGTISGAARELNVTPPAVSLQLRELEASAGIPLIERTDVGMQPTAGGREILAAAKSIDSLLTECAEALETLAGTSGGRVTVGAVSTAKYFVPHALAVFAKAHPRVEVRLQVGNRRETIAALAGYDLDFAVMGRPPEDFAVDRAVIGDHPHVIIGPPDHPFATRKRVPLAELARETFLLREPGSGTRMLMSRLFGRAELNPNLGMEMGSNETIKQAVMAGLGIALISAHTIAAEVADGRLVVLDAEGLPMVRQWFVVKRREKRLLPAAQALWAFLAKGSEFLPTLPENKTKRHRR